MQSKFYAIFALVLIAVTVTVSWELGHFLVQQSQETMFGVILALLAAAGVSSIAVGATYSKLRTSRQQCLMLLRDLAFERREHATFRTEAQAQIRTLRAKLRAETDSAQQAAAGARDRIQSIHGLPRAGFTADYTSLVSATHQPQPQQETAATLNPVTVAVATTLLDFSVDTAGAHQVCEPVTTYTSPIATSSHAAECSTFSSGGDSGSACDSGSSCSGD